MTSNEVKLPKSWQVSSRVSPRTVFWIFTLFSFFVLHVDDAFLVQETEKIHAERWTWVQKLCGGGNHESYQELWGGVTSVK